MIVKNKTAYIITFISVIINMILWSGSYDYLEKLYDFRFRLRGPISGDYISNFKNKFQDNKALKFDKRKNDIVILGLDQTSYEMIGRYYPYDRGDIWQRLLIILFLPVLK